MSPRLRIPLLFAASALFACSGGGDGDGGGSDTALDSESSEDAGDSSGGADGGRDAADTGTGGDTTDPDASVETGEPDTADAAPDVPESTTPETDHWLDRGSWRAAKTTWEFVDTTRSTPSSEVYEGAPTRTLKTDLYMPEGLEGRLPLLIYAHGLMSLRSDNIHMIEALVSRGYAVAALDFPRTNRMAPHAPDISDVIDQPGDLRFVLDRLLEFNADVENDLHGRFDEERIGLVGLSLGALTVLLSTYHPDYADERVDAVIAMAAPTCYLPVPFFTLPPIPTMLLHGDLDAIVAYPENAPPAWEQARAPRIFVTLHGGNHASFADATSELFDRLENSDLLGCGTIGQYVDMSDVGTLAESLGGRDAEVIDAECPLPCTFGAENEPAMRATRQAALGTVSTVAFFEAFFHGDASARNFLVAPPDGTAIFDAENSDVSIQSDVPLD